MTDQVAVRLGWVLVCISSDRIEGDLVEEYTPAAAREFAAELVEAADQAEAQRRTIEVACAQGHDWDGGTNLGDGARAHTVWRCQREGCQGQREEAGHHVDDSAAIADLLAMLPPDDELGAILLDFEGHPNLTLMGLRMSREDRIDAAAMRGHMSKLLREALNDHQPPALGKALAVPVCPTCRSGVVLTECKDPWHKRPHMTSAGPFNIHVDPAVPADTVFVIGSCWCKHPVMDHGPTGCTFQLGPTTRCGCATPISALTAVIRTEPK